MSSPFKTQISSFVPLLLGAFFLLLGGVSCENKQSKTAQWVSKPAEVVADSPPPENSDAEPTQPEEAQAPFSEGNVRFLAYNLENYLTMRRGQSFGPKPQKEIDAVVGLIARQQPDILGVSEIGTEEDLLDLQARLKTLGIDLPHYEHTGGSDDTRHLGLLSRFPIIARDSQRDLSFEHLGKQRVIGRGILDATIDAGGSPLRFLGVHLKSKREIEDGDQELIRQSEARLLREHADEILKADPQTHLLAYGDFNDTIGSLTLSIVRGDRGTPYHMPDFYFKDSRGELWTHFWDYQDTYSRIDYVLFSRALRSAIVGKESKIIDDPSWARGSDHRALLLVIGPH